MSMTTAEEKGSAAPLPPAPRKREGFAGKLADAAGMSILYGIFYFVLTVLLAAVIENGAFSRIETDRLNDTGLWSLKLMYGFAAALLFGTAGMMLAAFSRRRPLFVYGCTIPMTLLGPVIWYAAYRISEGPMDGMEGSEWFLYWVYAYWASPLIEHIRHYVPAFSVKYIGLAAAAAPGLFAACGAILLVYLRRNRAGLWKVILGLLSVPAVLAAVLAVGLLLPRTYPFTVQTYPKVDGATAAIPLGRELAHRLTGMNRPQTELFVHFHTTHNAYLNLIDKKADLILAAGPSEEERRLAEARGVRMKLTPIGKDAFIFLVHRDNPVDSLTAQQIRDIYAGQAANWSEVGGADDAIVAYQREPNSGSQTYMESKVMQGGHLAEAPKERKITGMGGLIDTVAAYSNAKNALGYSFYYFASEMHKRESVKFVAVNGVAASKETIRAGTYPYTAVLYAVTREDEPQDSPASRMLEWLQSEAGGHAIERGGFIPIREGAG
jgi:phosphate transport system substrate-binding protein